MKRFWQVVLFLILFAGLAYSLNDKGVKKPAPELCVESGPAYFGPAFSDVYRVLFSNLREPDSLSPVRYALPAKIFLGIYLWDTAFIAQVWKIWDAQVAEDVNAAVMLLSDHGRLQHFVSKYDSSEFTQPAVMAWSVWELYKWTGDIEYIKRYYPVLKDYNRWLYQNRRLENGLFYWEHPYESGIDNSPRFSSRDESDTADMRNLAAVDLSSYLVRQMRCLAEMAGELGREDDAKKFNKRADEVSALINELLWDTESEMYYDLDTMTGELIMVNSIAGLFPLFAGAAPQDRAESLLRHIMNPDEYNTLIPLPSVARNDPSYETDMWRGPVWVNTAYMVIVGMEDYGFRKDAAELAWRLVQGVYRTWEETGKIYEFYDPDRTGIKNLHRKRGNLYKKLTLGDRPRKNFVGWTGLVNNLLVEHLIGLKKQAGSFRLAPYFPEAASGMKMILSLPAHDMEINVDVKNPGEIFFDVKGDKGKQEFKMSSGENRDL